MRVFPTVRSCRFKDVEYGGLFVAEVGKGKGYNLKCFDLGKAGEKLDLAAFLGPELPEGFDILSVAGYYQEDDCVLDFGKEFIIEASTEFRHIEFGLPSPFKGPWGLVIAGDATFLRVKEVRRQEAIYVELPSAKLTSNLPGGPLVLMAEWSLRLPVPPEIRDASALEALFSYNPLA